MIIFILNMRVQNWKTSSFLTVTSVKRQEQELYLDFFITKNLVLNKHKSFGERGYIPREAL